MKTSAYLEELKSLTVADLQSQLVDAKKELFNLRFQNATNQLDNTARIKEVRKNIARIQTVITEKASVAEALRLATHKLPCRCKVVSRADLEGGESNEN